MSVTFITRRAWQTLTAAVKRSQGTAVVGVAYFGQGAARLLPLHPGSRLVVDASEGAVKTGQTCPAELKKLQRKGVRVFSARNLHAKVFVLGSKAFIGSTNASRYSAHTLLEAMVSTADRQVVAAARQFVRDLCVHELGPEELGRLAKLYRPPRVSGHRPRRIGGRQTGAIDLPRVLLAQLSRDDPPEGSEDAEKAGRQVAERRRKGRRTHDLDDFWWTGNCPFRLGDVVVQVTKEQNDRPMISPPGTVVHIRAWRRGNKKTTFVYVELPAQRRVALGAMAKRLGSGSAKRLRRGGLVGREFAERLLQAWNR